MKKELSVFDVDDGGAFDRLVKESRRFAESNGGTEAEATNWLETKILEAFICRIQKDSMGAMKLEGTAKKNSNSGESNKTDCLGSLEEKKKTGLTIVLKRKRSARGGKCWELERDNEENKKGEKTMSNGGGIKKELKLSEASTKLSSQLEKRIAEKGGADIKLVITKKISNTDLNKHHGRLLIPLNQIRKGTYFLTEQEEATLAKKEKGSNEIGVMLMEPCGEESSMILVKWSMRKSDNYCLRTSWNKVLERNHDKKKYFKLEDDIQLWSFRVGPQLWFAIHKT